MERTEFTYFGNIEDVQRRLAAMVENVNRDWVILLVNQGFPPVDEVKRYVDTFGKKL